MHLVFRVSVARAGIRGSRISWDKPGERAREKGRKREVAVQEVVRRRCERGRGRLSERGRQVHRTANYISEGKNEQCIKTWKKVRRRARTRITRSGSTRWKKPTERRERERERDKYRANNDKQWWTNDADIRIWSSWRDRITNIILHYIGGKHRYGIVISIVHYDRNRDSSFTSPSIILAPQHRETCSIENVTKKVRTVKNTNV